MNHVTIHDNVLPDPGAYRAAALRQDFHDVPLAGQVFKGIAEAPNLDLLAAVLRLVPSFTPSLSFLRKSPIGQVEPNDIHSDADMGDLTAIYYMNPDPPASDGTLFWQHEVTGRDCGPWGPDEQKDGHERRNWWLMRSVPARYNRLLLFKSDLYHSRARVLNYGEGDNARLIHVVFGTLNPKPC